MGRPVHRVANTASIPCLRYKICTYTYIMPETVVHLFQSTILMVSNRVAEVNASDIVLVYFDCHGCIVFVVVFTLVGGLIPGSDLLICQ